MERGRRLRFGGDGARWGGSDERDSRFWIRVDFRVGSVDGVVERLVGFFLESRWDSYDNWSAF